MSMLRRLISTRSLTANIKVTPFITNATRYIRFRSTTLKSKSKPSPEALPSPDRSYDTSSHPIRRGIAWAVSFFLTWHIITGYVLFYGPCDGISMLPTFNSFGDAVLISNFYRRGRGVKVGDVISYIHPIEPETTGLKRIAGMEGDFVLRDTPSFGLEDGQEKMLQVCAEFSLANVLSLRLDLCRVVAKR